MDGYQFYHLDRFQLEYKFINSLYAPFQDQKYLY